MDEMHWLSDRSWRRLVGVRPELAAIVARALQLAPFDFTVLEGLRTRQRQAELVAEGASETMRSRHLTGHAVDLGVLIDGQISWQFRYYRDLRDAMLVAAREFRVPLEWGGNWRDLRDGPHFQLPWTTYPER